MQQVKSGDTVKVHYHGKLTDGTTFDSSQGRDPLEFEVGSGTVIAGFDKGVTGMQVGEKKTINIPVDEAYGQKQDDLLMEFPLDRFPADMQPEVGMQLNMSNGSGRSEEHTSELQSRQYLVCRLLLEKKKKRPKWIAV